jgi:hypothetical protein
VQKETTGFSGVCRSLIIRGEMEMGGWVAIFFNLFSSAIQMACVNFPVFEVKNNIRKPVSETHTYHAQQWPTPLSQQIMRLDTM